MSLLTFSLILRKSHRDLNNYDLSGNSEKRLFLLPKDIIVKNLLSITLLLSMLSVPVFAQELSGNTISAYAGSSHPKNSIEWSIGFISTEDFKGDDFSISSGFGAHYTELVTSVFNDETSEENIYVFPNPFVQRFSVKSAGILAASIRLKNAMGAQIPATVIAKQANEIEILTKHLAAGVYILEIINPLTKKTSSIKIFSK